VNEFVEECRREWKRLGVPESAAAEMAADLTADLAEAEAEGASAEEVLGTAAFDPRGFAAAWAAERGLVRRPPPSRRVRRAAAIATVFTVIAIVGAALAIPADSRPTRLELPSAPERGATAGAVWIAAAPRRGISATYTISTPDVSRARVDAHTFGSVLLVVGLAGSVLSTLFWLWLGRHEPGRRGLQIR
jgi:hypothetical protein